ncbi:HalOD1 output domain-containing protein [Halorussus salinus]|uniref:HalOD1 output domain-containing protein n=1 Tax=Halorussus salinus TaxID=1364935 RepID=UPI0010923932|nr:HalOD1 output domain-containing protein [Halorussus salinus]
MSDETLLPTDGRLDYDETNDCYTTTYDPSEESPSEVTVNAVAAVEECDPSEMEPLQHSVDAEAVDDLFARTPGGRVRESGRVEFRLADHRVVVEADGDVEIHPRT